MTPIRHDGGSAPLVVGDALRAVEVVGPDRASFLDATLSQAVATLADGQVRGALWLDVHGAPLAMAHLASDPDGERWWLVADPASANALVEGLGARTFLAQVEFRLTDLQVVVMRGCGPDAGDRPGPGTCQRDGEVLVLADPGPGAREGDLLLAGSHGGVAAWLEQRGLPPVAEGPDAIADLLDQEIGVGRPRFGFEVTGPHLPEEIGLLPTHVHLDKGCYPGQEAVARMWMLGRPRRRLAVLELDGRAEVGAQAGSGRDRVTLTRVTAAPPWFALAFVPPKTGAGVTVDGGDWQATVVSVVGEGLEQPGVNPAAIRRRDR